MTDVSLGKDNLIKFWKTSASGPNLGFFKEFLQHGETEHFSTIWFISPEKNDQIFLKILSEKYL